MLKDERMTLIYSLVREGKNALDVGTDHAIIPIELVQSGRSPRAKVTDISLPSLKKGEKNIALSGLSGKIIAYCTDGTLGASLEDTDDIIIAGMGGELMVKILSQDERLRDGRFHFILQPMTKPEELRRYLYESGFTVESEAKVYAEGRAYAVISAFFTGEKRTYSLLDTLLGVTPNRENGAEIIYAERLLAALKVKLDGLKKAETPDASLIEATERAALEIARFLG